MKDKAIHFSADFKNFRKILGYNEEMVLKVTDTEARKATEMARVFIQGQARKHKNVTITKDGKKQRRISPYEESIQTSKEKKGKDDIYYTYSDVLHAVWLEAGTKAHVIEPVKAKALMFYLPEFNFPIFAKRVHHPGTKANNYFKKAFIRRFVGLSGRIVNSIKARAARGGK